MGVVDDLRQVIQDEVTPDFRALEARVVALERRLDDSVKSLNEKIELSAKSLNEKIELSTKSLNEKIESTAKELKDRLDQTVTKNELALLRELISAEFQNTRMHTELHSTRVTMAMDLDKRLAAVERDRARDGERLLNKSA